jgi:hypothetical protein
MISRRFFVTFATAVIATLYTADGARADGGIDPDTIVANDFGRFNGIDYVQYDAMFEGETSTNHPYRVPCQMIAPAPWEEGSGVLVFDWLNNSLIFFFFGPDGFQLPLLRLGAGDDFLCSSGHAYAAIRSDPNVLGLPWLNPEFEATGEFIAVPADEFEIVRDFVGALTVDPVASDLVGSIERTTAFGYSESGYKLRGFVRDPLGRYVFDLSISGGTGAVSAFPNGVFLDAGLDPLPPPAAGGLELSINTETEAVDVDFNQLHTIRRDARNARSYEFAGAAHNAAIPETYALLALSGAPDIETVNPLDWTPFVRALFVAGLEWTDGVEPPPSIWLNRPGDPAIVRDDKGNALVRYVGGRRVTTPFFRHPEVGVGLGRYGAIYGEEFTLRYLSGEFIDLSHTFRRHGEYVAKITAHTLLLFELGYLLEPDAREIIRRAVESNVGNK